jgi:ABC-2 type transport system permease protein
MNRLIDKLVAVARRDLLTAVRHRGGFMVFGAGAFAEAAAFYFLSRAIGPAFRPDGMDYFPFLLVGTGLYTFLVMGINSFLVTVQDAQHTGTLEVLMTTPTQPPILLLLSAVSAFAGNSLQFLFYLGVGVLCFHASFRHINAVAFAAVFGLSLLVALSLGIFAAALQLSIQRGSLLVWFLGSGAWFLTGTLFPVTSLPQPLQTLGKIIPITHSLEGMRMVLLQGSNAAALKGPVGMLALFSVVLLPTSVAAFSYTLRRARYEGTLSSY